MFDGCAIRYGGSGCLLGLILRHPFPLRDQYKIVIQGIGRGVEGE